MSYGGFPSKHGVPWGQLTIVEKNHGFAKGHDLQNWSNFSIFHIYVTVVFQRVTNNRKSKSFTTAISFAIWGTQPTCYRSKLLGYSKLHMTRPCQRQKCRDKQNLRGIQANYTATWIPTFAPFLSFFGSLSIRNPWNKQHPTGPSSTSPGFAETRRLSTSGRFLICEPHGRGDGLRIKMSPINNRVDQTNLLSKKLRKMFPVSIHVRHVRTKLHTGMVAKSCNSCWFIPLFTGFQPSKVVQDFFHPQYHVVCHIMSRLCCLSPPQAVGLNRWLTKLRHDQIGWTPQIFLAKHQVFLVKLPIRFCLPLYSPSSNKSTLGPSPCILSASCPVTSQSQHCPNACISLPWYPIPFHYNPI